MNKSVLIHLALAAVCSAPVALAAGVGELRAPAYPLVTIDPYISVWSMSDNLYEEEVKHWTETAMPLVGVATVDGESYRFMERNCRNSRHSFTPHQAANGPDVIQLPNRQPTGIFATTMIHPGKPEPGLLVLFLPMNTIYGFECGPVDLTLTFTAPVFLDNLDLLSRPVNYITYGIDSRDGKTHDVKLYFEAGREWAVENTSQKSKSGLSQMVKKPVKC